MEIPTIYAEEHLSEPWFTLILLGLKTCEGRLHKHRFKDYKIGDIINAHCCPLHRASLLRVVYYYPLLPIATRCCPLLPIAAHCIGHRFILYESVTLLYRKASLYSI